MHVQRFAQVFGAVYLLVGLLGFLVTGFDGFTEHDHSQTLLGFAVNPLHNIVHILIGALGLAMWKRSDSARTFGWILFVVYGLPFVDGLIAGNDENLDFLTLNGADSVLPLLSARAGRAIAVWPRNRDPRGTTRGPP